jgi:hypothetical protein
MRRKLTTHSVSSVVVDVLKIISALVVAYKLLLPIVAGWF